MASRLFDSLARPILSSKSFLDQDEAGKNQTLEELRASYREFGASDADFDQDLAEMRAPPAEKPSMQMAPAMKLAWDKAKSVVGDIPIASGGRTIEEQARLFDQRKGTNLRPAAAPGKSLHNPDENGFFNAVDVNRSAISTARWPGVKKALTDAGFQTLPDPREEGHFFIPRGGQAPVAQSAPAPDAPVAQTPASTPIPNVGSSDVYRIMMDIKQNPAFETLPPDQQQAVLDLGKNLHQNLTAIEEFERVEAEPKPVQEDPTVWNVLGNIFRSFERIPVSTATTVARMAGAVPRVAGAGIEVLGGPTGVGDETAKGLYGWANEWDQLNQEVFPNTIRPPNVEDFRNALSLGGALSLAGRIAPLAPEVMGSTAAMAAPAAILGKAAGVFGAGARAADAAKKAADAGRAIEAIGLLDKANKIGQSASNVGLGIGSLLTSLGGLDSAELGETGKMSSIGKKLPYSALVALADMISPFSSEKTLAQALSGTGRKEALSALSRIGAAAKDILFEFPQEGFQSLAESASKKADQGFVPSLQSTWADPKARADAATEGLAAAWSASIGHGGAALRNRNQEPAAPTPLEAMFRFEQATKAYDAALEGGDPVRIAQALETLGKASEEFRQSVPRQAPPETIMPTPESLEQTRARGVAEALRKIGEQQAQEQARKNTPPPVAPAAPPAQPQAAPAARPAQRRPEDNPVLSFIRRAGGIMPAGMAKTTGGEYDGAPEARMVGPRVMRAVFGGRKLRADQMAQQLFDHGLIGAPTPNAMWDAVSKEAGVVGRQEFNRQDVMDEAEATWLKNDAEQVNAQQLKVGDQFTVHGEPFKVLEEGDSAIRIKDGIEFWLPFDSDQTGGWLPIDKGSLNQKKEEPVAAPPAPSPQVVPQQQAQSEQAQSSPATPEQQAPEPAPSGFVPSSEWQEIPKGTPVPPGGEFRMDMDSGKNFGRWPEIARPESAPTPVPPSASPVRPGFDPVTGRSTTRIPSAVPETPAAPESRVSPVGPTTLANGAVRKIVKVVNPPGVTSDRKWMTVTTLDGKTRYALKITDDDLVDAKTGTGPYEWAPGQEVEFYAHEMVNQNRPGAPITLVPFFPARDKSGQVTTPEKAPAPAGDIPFARKMPKDTRTGNLFDMADQPPAVAPAATEDRTSQPTPAVVPQAGVPAVVRIRENETPANHVVMNLVDDNGATLGNIAAPYDGTPEDARRVAMSLTDRAESETNGRWSNVGSRTIATDENGRGKFAISPNRARVSPVGSDAAQYTLSRGQAGAPDPSLETVARAVQPPATSPRHTVVQKDGMWTIQKPDGTFEDYQTSSQDAARVRAALLDLGGGGAVAPAVKPVPSEPKPGRPTQVTPPPNKGKKRQDIRFQRKDPAPWSFSQAIRVAEEKVPNRATPDQIRGILSEKNAVKAEELEWLDLDNFLAGKTVVSKEDLLKHMREHEVKVEEVQKPGKLWMVTAENSDIEWYETEEQANEAAENWRENLRDDMGKEASQFDVYFDDDYGFYLVDSYGNPIASDEYYETEEEANEAGTEWAENRLEELDDLVEVRYAPDEAEDGDKTKFARWQEPGGEDYRELLLTMPNVGSETDLIAIARQMGYKIGAGSQEDFLKLPTADRLKIIAESERRDKEKQNYRSSHWDEPNVLVHVRFNTRTDADGKKVLFIEEIQSDWHQAGRSRGYLKPAHLEIERKIKAGETISDEEMRIYHDEMGPFPVADGVPNAPFKKSWSILAVKRMIRYAAENGYDRIAWTPGAVQADRYDLSEQVEKIAWGAADKSDPSAGTEVAVFTDDQFADEAGPSISFRVGSDGKVVSASPGHDSAIGKHLSDVVGKGISEKISASQTGEISWPDLKIGGKGMIGFYDKILPNEVQKYVKKWGSKVGTSAVDDMSAHSIDVTQAMRESAMAGQPLFQRKEAPDALRQVPKRGDQSQVPGYRRGEGPGGQPVPAGQGGMGRGSQTRETAALGESVSRVSKDDRYRGAYFEVDPGTVSEEAQIAADLARDLFGMPTTIVGDNHPKGSWWNGLLLDGKAFIHKDSNAPFMAITGHELLHFIAREHPDLYRVLADAARGEMVNVEGYKDRLRRAGAEEMTDDYVAQEILGDFTGDQMTDPGFWRKLADRIPGAFVELANVVQGFLRKISNWLLGRDLGSSRYFRDIEKVRNALADTLAEVHRRQSGMSPVQRSVAGMGATETSGSELERAVRGLGSVETDMVASPRVQDEPSYYDASPWEPDFPDVMIHTTVPSLYGRPEVEMAIGGETKKVSRDYKAAKEGDAEAALRVVKGLVKPKKAMELAEEHPTAVIVPVRAQESSGTNKLASAMARVLSTMSGLPVHDGVFQTNRTHHTGRGALHRMMASAEFDGPVVRGQDYILVDDVATSGATLAALRHYITSRGGRVVDITTLAAAQGSTKLAMNQDTLRLLRKKFDKASLDDMLKEYGIAKSAAHLTNSQGRYLLQFSSLDSIRARIDEGRFQGGREADGRPVGERSGVAGEGEGRPEGLEEEPRPNKPETPEGLKFSRKLPSEYSQAAEDLMTSSQRDRGWGEKPVTLSKEESGVFDQVVKALDHAILKTGSEVSRESKVFKQAVEANPLEAKSIEEWNRAYRLNRAEAQESIGEDELAKYLRDDNSVIHQAAGKVLDVLENLTASMVGPGVKERGLRAVRSILAPTLLLDPVQKLFARIGERIYWNRDTGRMEMVPGFREMDPKTGKFTYQPDEDITADMAMRAYEALPAHLQKILSDRAKRNEEYRQRYLRVVLPAKRMQLAASLAAKNVDRGGPVLKEWESIFNRSRAMLQGVTPEDLAAAKLDQGTIDQAIRTFDQAKDSEGKPGKNLTSEQLKAIDRAIYEGQRLLGKLESDQGIYGYVHHTGFDPRKEMVPDELLRGLGIQSFGHPWFENIAASQKARHGEEGYVANLWISDTKQRMGEADAALKNEWMRRIEDMGVPMEYDDADGKPAKITTQEELDERSGAPGEFRVSDVVQAKFGKNAGKIVFLPFEAYERYQAELKKPTADFAVGALEKAMKYIRENWIYQINRALLFHPAKMARDLTSSAFHIVDFLTNWPFRNYRDLPYLPQIAWDAFKGLFRPDVWKRLSRGRLGEYSELQSEMDENGTQHHITWALDQIGNAAAKKTGKEGDWGGLPIGRVLAAMTHEFDLAGAGDIPVKRFFIQVGEALADRRGLTGAPRERFIRKIVSEYGFETTDLSPLLNWIRGKEPSAGSKAAGMIQGTTVPFLGYSTSLVKRMFVDAINKGVLGRGDAEMGDTETGARIGYAVRPLIWSALIYGLARGMLGGDDEEEYAAIPLQGMEGIGTETRVPARIPVGRDEEGETYLSAKGFAHPSLAKAVYDVVKGRAGFGDLFTEFQTLHPVAGAVANWFGYEGPYQAGEKFGSKFAKFLANLAVPQLVRAGPDLSKAWRMVLGDKTIPDTRKAEFLDALSTAVGLGNLGIEEVTGLGGRTPPKLNKKFEALKYDPMTEVAKSLAGMNLKRVEYSSVAGDLESITRRMEQAQEKLDQLNAFKATGSGFARRRGFGSAEEQEFLKAMGLSSHRSVDDAIAALESEISEERRARLRQALENLPGEDQESVDPGTRRFLDR